MKYKNQRDAYLYAFLLGILGAHKFYLGQKNQGYIYLFITFTILLIGEPSLFIYVWIASWVEAYILYKKTKEQFDSKYNAQYFSLIDKEKERITQLDVLRNGDIPKLIPSEYDLSINLDSDETLSYINEASLMKMKSRTDRINYGGFGGSVKIAGPLRYHVGSTKVQSQKTNYMNTEDVGQFYITSKHIGFQGNKSHFAFPLKKLHLLKEDSGYLQIYKDGKETPYLILMDDYTVPTVISDKLLKAL